MGRAARNINGKAIMYADKITGSMQRAIKETNRRREKQIKFNTEHNIKPKTIIKNIQDIMEGARSKTTKRLLKIPKSIQKTFDPKHPEKLSKTIEELEIRMFEAAKNLEFEEAAKLRDEVKLIKEFNFGISYVDTEQHTVN